MKKYIPGIIIALTLLMGLLLFNIKIDEGGDDSTYICRAIDLIETGRYPSFQGPLYPMFLALFVAVFGCNVTLLKMTSLVLIVAAQWLFWWALRRRVDNKLIYVAMALLGINALYLHFASQTYSEALYMCLSYVFVGLVMRFSSLKELGMKQLAVWGGIIGLVIVSGYLTRTVGLVWIGVAVLYLALEKQWKRVAAVVVSTIVLMGAWSGVKHAIWGEVKGAEQSAQLTLVHPYEPEKGQETLTGYMGRIVDNSMLYFGKHIPTMLGAREFGDRTKNGLAVVMVYALFGFGAYRAWKKRNKGVLMMAIYAFCMIGVTFVALQALWDQYRLVVPYLAALTVVCFYAISELASMYCGSAAHYVFGGIAVFCLVLVGAQSVKKIDSRQIYSNLHGNKYYGYTPDWINFLSLCEYVGKDMKDTYVAVRKPNMARIYAGGKKFYGIYNFDTEDADELLKRLKDNGVTHMMLASLRRDPLVLNGEVINTLHRYMKFVADKYPNAFSLVCTMGDQQNEPAYLFKVNYPNLQTGADGAAEQRLND